MIPLEATTDDEMRHLHRDDDYVRKVRRSQHTRSGDDHLLLDDGLYDAPPKPFIFRRHFHPLRDAADQDDSLNLLEVVRRLAVLAEHSHDNSADLCVF
jgi:hypothetical protein